MPPPFRADQIGSLMRPDKLLSTLSGNDTPLSLQSTLRNQIYYSTEPLAEESESILNAATTEVVRKQQELGIKPITSGEYGRVVFFSGFFEHLEGMRIDRSISVLSGCRQGNPFIDFLKRINAPYLESVVAVGPICNGSKSQYLAEWQRLRHCLPEEQWKYCKMTVPAITWQHIHLAPGTVFTAQSGYTDDNAYFKDLSVAMANEWSLLYEAGLRNIQVDDPGLAYFLSDDMHTGCLEQGIDPEFLLDQYIWAHNLVLAKRPQDLHAGVHLCRGNLPDSVSLTAASYERISRKIFTQLDYDTFYLEYDSDKAGGFSPLRHVPEGKNVVLGLISTKSPDMENVEELIGRVYKAADVIASGQGRSREEVLDSLAISPQCGFSSNSAGSGKGMTVDRMWQKLQLVQEVAGRIWGC
ncbi:5-methyltetrahydropteroyltriglutamate-homocysteine methyltransferase [Aspergillus granulosus]|uniref:5-methyltetrahydropteroyltriglutamate-homocysteine methyltransferase n=1 Tax=Aspergillus granulosus TaxID=176169 RepID=A0ABR4GRY5_9EURO